MLIDLTGVFKNGSQSVKNTLNFQEMGCKFSKSLLKKKKTHFNTT